jgi:hypothetical protein
MVNVPFLTGGGEMGELIHAHDWFHHSLGQPDGWPQALRTGIRLILNSRHQMCVLWGDDATWFYSDAFRQTLTDKRHPSSLGLPSLKVWPEIWDDIGGQISQVMSGGSATWHENQHLVRQRGGRKVDTYWTYSYSPIDDETAPCGVGGVLVVCTETTEQVAPSKPAIVEHQGLAELFEQAPSLKALLHGPEHIFEMANPSSMRLIGGRAVLGRSVADALPDAAEQGFVALLDTACTTGKPYVATSSNAY